MGIYAQDLIAITDKFKVLAGLRWSYLENKNTIVENYLNNTKTYKASSGNPKESAFSPRVGLVYQIDDSFSTFASYSNSFNPNSGRDINNLPLPSSLIDQYEIGLKKIYGKTL